ncbi:hypothetical protein B0A77_00170 [Flavobacterium branchiophilum]|uniref:Uncharacterized protein n=1 Tax=Flavobacterium branchiophilum TaxID=55197 RepID=A0A2H3L2B7_9FLAO|nr:hypothetical protein B0A77_00170 [Flavobacterium branchiophilum]
MSPPPLEGDGRADKKYIVPSPTLPFGEGDEATITNQKKRRYNFIVFFRNLHPTFEICIISF